MRYLIKDLLLNTLRNSGAGLAITDVRNSEALAAFQCRTSESKRMERTPRTCLYLCRSSGV